jgi:hypothetical protein
MMSQEAKKQVFILFEKEARGMLKMKAPDRI